MSALPEVMGLPLGHGRRGRGMTRALPCAWHARSDAMGRWQVAGLVKHNAKGPA